MDTDRLRNILESLEVDKMLEIAKNNSFQPLVAYLQAEEAKHMAARYINVAKMLNDEDEISKGENLYTMCKEYLQSVKFNEI